MRRIEWWTVGLLIAVYGMWLSSTLYWESVPTPLLFVLGGWIVCWHGSLQHEAIHGHPSRHGVLNALLVGWPLLLYLPYARYRDTHLAHHKSDLTDPFDDPESFYRSKAAWADTSRLERATVWTCQTLLGRLVLGPIVTIAAFLHGEIVTFDRGRARVWLTHVAWSLPVLAWLLFVAKIPLTTYVLCFVYPGVALTLMRSFAEHRPEKPRAHRSVIVEAEWPLALLYLNNNLHSIHHDEPGLPWYQLPARYREMKNQTSEKNGGYVFRGYREIARRWLLEPKDAPVHPQ